APAARRRPCAPRPAPVAPPGPPTASTARHLGIKTAFPQAPGAGYPDPQRQPGLSGPAFQGRLRAGGVLAVVAPVAALGVLRDAGAPAELLGVAVEPGLEAGISE